MEARGPRSDGRAEARAADPALAARFERYRKELGLSEEEAGVLAGDGATAAYFDSAVAARASPRSAARWLVNELLGLARGAALDTLPLAAPAFGRFVSLVDAGRLTQAAAKALLASLVGTGGDPEARMKELGIEKVEDRNAALAAVDRALASQKAEADRYRAGEKKLFGVLLGAAMRQAGGTADPALVRELLQRRLG